MFPVPLHVGALLALLVSVSMATTLEFVKFELDLLKSVALHETNQGQNLALSSFSAASALALAYAGAGEKTKKEFLSKVAGDADADIDVLFKSKLAKVFNNSGDITLEFANRAFASKSLEVHPGYVKKLQDSYKAALEKLDFSKSSAAADRINEFVEQKTHGKIRQILNSNDLDASTQLVLANALYFKGAFVSAFNKNLTKAKPFHVAENAKIEVPTMSKSLTAPFVQLNDSVVVRLPYRGDAHLILILPKERFGLNSVINNLTPEAFEMAVKGGTRTRLELCLPKFTVESTLALKPHLQEIGLVQAFSRDADFSGISDAKLKVDRVQQKVFFKTDESGTEAAAVTAVISRMAGPARVVDPVKVAFDHPFLFFLEAREQVVFSGLVRIP